MQIKTGRTANKISLGWVLRHLDVSGKEQADERAKKVSDIHPSHALNEAIIVKAE